MEVNELPDYRQISYLWHCLSSEWFPVAEIIFESGVWGMVRYDQLLSMLENSIALNLQIYALKPFPSMDFNQLIKCCKYNLLWESMWCSCVVHVMNLWCSIKSNRIHYSFTRLTWQLLTRLAKLSLFNRM